MLVVCGGEAVARGPFETLRYEFGPQSATTMQQQQRRRRCSASATASKVNAAAAAAAAASAAAVVVAASSQSNNMNYNNNNNKFAVFPFVLVWFGFTRHKYHGNSLVKLMIFQSFP